MKAISINGKNVKQITLNGGMYFRAQEAEPWKEYGELAEYLIADTQQYTITDWTPTFGDYWEFSVTPTDVSTVYVYGGARESASSLNQYILFPTTAIYIGNGGNSKYGITIDGSSRGQVGHNYTIKANRDSVYINDTLVPYATSRNNAPVPFMLGTVSNNGVPDSRRSKGHFYRLVVNAEDGKPKHNYVPFYVSKKAIQDVKGKNYPIGSFVWYDLVTNTVPQTIGTWGGMTLEKSIQTLSEVGVTPTSNIEENLQMLNDLGIE